MRIVRLDQALAALAAGGNGLEVQQGLGWWVHNSPVGNTTSLLEVSYGREIPGSLDSWEPLAPGATSHRAAQPFGSFRVRLATGVTGVAGRGVVLYLGTRADEQPPASRFPHVDSSGRAWVANRAAPLDRTFTNAFAASALVVAAATGLELWGFNALETGAVNALLRFRETDAVGDVLATVDLLASSHQGAVFPLGLEAAGGIYVELVGAATVQLTVLHKTAV